MTAVASLTHVRVVVDRRSTAHLIAKINKVKDLAVILLPRDAMHKRGLCCHAVSVRLAVRLSRSCLVSK